MDIVGRAELKIAEAANAFRFSFRDKVVLDIGSSTGGFTEFALRNGAKKVIAVEKGSHQMKAPLRDNPRVELHEKTDIMNVRTAENKPITHSANAGYHPGIVCEMRNRLVSDNTIIPKVDVILADVSFISLRPILLHAKKSIADSGTEFLVMLKPQFEARPEQLVRGVVKNEKMRREIIKDFELWLRDNGFLVVNKRDNETVGKNGNKERFYLLKLY